MSLFDVYYLFDITPVKAEGMYVYDDKGQQYLDLYGGHAVISIGHSHPKYVESITEQVGKIGFYSNSVKNPLQEELASKLCEVSDHEGYQLFMCNSGAEANENALKLASFVTGRKKVLAIRNGFHGRTSAAVASTDNPKIIAPINAQHQTQFIDLGDLDKAEEYLKDRQTCAVIMETIQGVGGLDEGTTEFYKGLENLCKNYDTILIADEVQSGFGRTGDFFAFQKHGISPQIISMAKGMGNGFPVGGILIHPDLKPTKGMLGTTFGGNHLACAAVLAVLSVIREECLMENVKTVSDYWKSKLNDLSGIKAVKGRGLMLGLEFNNSIKNIREQLLFDHQIFTGNAKNPNLLRLLPPLVIKEKHIDSFMDVIENVLLVKQV